MMAKPPGEAIVGTLCSQAFAPPANIPHRAYPNMPHLAPSNVLLQTPGVLPLLGKPSLQTWPSDTADREEGFSPWGMLSITATDH
jgi:hypothetical protein